MMNTDNQPLETIQPLAEPQGPTPDLGREPLTHRNAQYQSQAFEIKLAINPLIAACAPLLMLCTQLREQLTAPDLDQLLTQLSHEVKVFENKSNALGYRSPIILAARYFICALIDETILTSTWGENSAWQQQNLLNTFQRELWGGERFFVILERSAEDPKPHLDLLELGYICLSLGFEGKYHDKPRSHHELGQLIDKLYYLIRDERGEFSKRLLIAPSNPQTPKKSWLHLPPVWVSITVAIIGLVASYLPYHLRLEKLATPVSSAVKHMQFPNQSATR